MFNNAGNKFNNNNGISINTRLYSSYSDACLFTIGAWNEQLSLRFAPMKGMTPDGVRQYAQDKSEVIATSLTIDNAITLIEGIEKYVIPAIKNKEAGDVSVTIGTNENKKILKVSTDGTNVFLTIYLGVNGDNVATGDSITHTFNKREYITSYDPTAGTGTTEEVNADFFNFVEKLVVCKDGLNQVVPHNINYGNAIKSLYKQSNTGFNSNKGYNGYNNNYSNNNSGYNQAPTSNYASIDDFLV